MPLRPSPMTTRTIRNGRRVVGATSVALLTFAATLAPAAADDSRSYDFEAVAAKEWPFRAINGFGAVDTAPAPGRSGTAARFNVPDDGKSFRAELALKGLSAGTHRFAFSNYLPADWKQSDDDIIVAQWFSAQPDSEGVKPVVALAVHGGDWRLKVHWLKDLATFEEYETLIPLGAAQFGRWNRWALDITWSTPATPGSITVTRDGVQVGAHRGDNNYHRGEPPHFRTGVYRPAWRPEKPKHPTGGPDVVLFVDDIAITAGPADAPAPAPATPAKSAPAPAAASPSTAAAPSAVRTAVAVPSATVPSAAVPSAAATATAQTATAPTPATASGAVSAVSSDATPQETAAAPTSTASRLSNTGTTTNIALAGGTVAIVVGTFLLRRRTHGRTHGRRH
ncbi:heparin lyase I family protein [Kitasatospora sp. NPDC059327]|uniref:heparin lyase I family protein n=1 Tax=Kitasatospora sp. NPDC059327 TaxID=3346803 RepID=UPI0036B86347